MTEKSAWGDVSPDDVEAAMAAPAGGAAGEDGEPLALREFDVTVYLLREVTEAATYTTTVEAATEEEAMDIAKDEALAEAEADTLTFTVQDESEAEVEGSWCD